MSAGEWIYRPGEGEALPAVLRPNGEGGHAYVAQFNDTEDARLCSAAREMADALEKLSSAAAERENTMGDPCRLLECKANLEAAVRVARAALVKAGRLDL